MLAFMLLLLLDICVNNYIVYYDKLSKKYPFFTFLFLYNKTKFKKNQQLGICLEHTAFK